MISAVLIGISLSMDAFAVSLANGLTSRGGRLFAALKMSTFFGFFQFIMPLLGYFLAGTLKEHVERFGPYISFALLAFIGIRMILNAVKKNISSDKKNDFSELKTSRLLALAVATSIDAFAVGVSFAFMDVSLLAACAVIGVVTFLLCMAGAMFANRFSGISAKTSEIIGGAVLIGIGIKLLLEGIL